MRSIAVRRGLERPLHDAPLPLVADKWPALDDPKASTVGFEAIGGSTLKAVGHATHGEALVARKRSLIRAASGRPATASQRQVLDLVTSHSRPKAGFTLRGFAARKQPLGPTHELKAARRCQSEAGNACWKLSARWRAR